MRLMSLPLLELCPGSCTGSMSGYREGENDLGRVVHEVDSVMLQNGRAGFVNRALTSFIYFIWWLLSQVRSGM